jgi:hypothetical protein
VFDVPIAALSINPIGSAITSPAGVPVYSPILNTPLIDGAPTANAIADIGNTFVINTPGVYSVDIYVQL